MHPIAICVYTSDTLVYRQSVHLILTNAKAELDNHYGYLKFDREPPTIKGERFYVKRAPDQTGQNSRRATLGSYGIGKARSLAALKSFYGSSDPNFHLEQLRPQLARASTAATWLCGRSE